MERWKCSGGTGRKEKWKSAWLEPTSHREAEGRGEGRVGRGEGVRDEAGT